MTKSEPHTGGLEMREANLRASNARKAERAEEKARAAVKELLDSGTKVNPHSVHRASGVSRTYIYSNKELLDFISRAGDIRADLKSSPSVPSLEARLATALRSNEELRDRLRAQREEIRRLGVRIENLAAQLVEKSLDK